jgi:hypothetical protein
MKQSAPIRISNYSIFLKTSFAIFCTLVLALAPQPSFAQHGGGGGSHGGGGHSAGGGHAAGGGRSGPLAGSTGGGSGSGSVSVRHASGSTRSSTSSVAASNATNVGSHIWVSSNRGSSTGSAPVEHFAAGNNVWQDPPNNRWGTGAYSGASSKASAVVRRSSMMAGSILAATRGPFIESTPRPVPPHIFPPRVRPRFFGNNFFFLGGGCFGGFFPGFCGSSLWSGPGYYWGPGCDPYAGCAGYGYGYSTYMTGAPDDMQIQSDTPSQENGPFGWRNSPEPEVAPESESDSADAPVGSKPAATIYLKDGTSYGVTDYWLAGGSLHYVTNYGGENSVAAERLDLQRTVDANAANGVSFILSNEPAPRE